MQTSIAIVINHIRQYVQCTLYTILCWKRHPLKIVGFHISFFSSSLSFYDSISSIWLLLFYTLLLLLVLLFRSLLLLETSIQALFRFVQAQRIPFYPFDVVIVASIAVHMHDFIKNIFHWTDWAMVSATAVSQSNIWMWEMSWVCTRTNCAQTQLCWQQTLSL